MAVSLRSPSPWPARAAYVAAAIFIGASGAVNITYGWHRGTDLPTSIIWASVAAAVAIVFALSWPALIRSLEERRVSAALIALCALVLSGAFSVSAALGSASAGRVQAGNTEQDAMDARERAQAAYDTAKGDLARLPPSRPAGELEALLAAAMRAPQRHGCAAINGSLRLSCPVLDAELARARQRERLAAAMEKASTDLAANKTTRPANSDAKTLARYLQAIGVATSAERLDDLLVLLSVLMIEAGGGLCLALAMALSSVPNASKRQPDTQERGETGTITPGITAAPAAQATDRSPVLAWLEAQGGRADTSTRRLGAALGRTPSSVHGELKRLVAAGSIAMAAGAKGTRIAIRSYDGPASTMDHALFAHHGRLTQTRG